MFMGTDEHIYGFIISYDLKRIKWSEPIRLHKK